MFIVRVVCSVGLVVVNVIAGEAGLEQPVPGISVMVPPMPLRDPP